MKRHAGDLLVLGVAAAIFLAQQLAISYIPLDGTPGTARRLLFLVTTIILAALALHFRRFVGAWLVAAGIILNVIPMTAHGGAMPIDYAILERSGAFPEVTEADIGRQTNHGKDIVLRREDIRFFWLSDRYIVDLPLYGTNIYSLGDFVLFAGLGLFVLQTLFDLLRPSPAVRPVAGLPADQPGRGER